MKKQKKNKNFGTETYQRNEAVKRNRYKKGFDKTNKIWNQFPDMKHISEQMITR